MVPAASDVSALLLTLDHNLIWGYLLNQTKNCKDFLQGENVRDTQSCHQNTQLGYNLALLPKDAHQVNIKVIFPT